MRELVSSRLHERDDSCFGGRIVRWASVRAKAGHRCGGDDGAGRRGFRGRGGEHSISSVFSGEENTDIGTVSYAVDSSVSDKSCFTLKHSLSWSS